eukprot:jgi/Ulvmu1/7085/UM033_0146.1
MSNRSSVHARQGMDSGRQEQAVPGSAGNVSQMNWFNSGASEGRKNASKAMTSEATDLETVFFEKYERRNWSISLFKEAGRWSIRVNPVSFGASVLLFWSFAIWCMVSPAEANARLQDVKRWVTFTFTWAYMLTQQAWVVFLILLYFSRLGSLKLGRPHDQPEFPTASWFMMMFSAGIGIGLFFFGVAEPIYHYEPCAADPPAGPGSACNGNRYSQLHADERAQWAMNLAFFHWGVHGWVAYCIVGLILATVVYRRDLPMTLKSAFHPIIGDKIFGWMGDTLDVLSVATTLFGVCTSLGLGVKQLNAGFARLNPAIAVNDTNQSIIIWVVTALATMSVVSGIRVGIRRISEVNFLIGQFLLLIVFFQEDSWYLLNNFTQSIAFYIQYFAQLGSHSDTFQMAPAETLTDSSGEDVHVTALAPAGTAANRNWMDSNTLFYFSWWIAWSPFVGMFIAKISRGRTVREVINGALTAPVVYCFIWFAVFGGTGLRIERQAANLGITCTEDAEGNSVFERMMAEGRAVPLPQPMVDLEGREFWRLSCRSSTEQWFDMFANFPMTKFYWGLSLASLILYFVTSSDSGSLVIDCLTANGNPHPPVLQRVFWSVTEGAVAMALLKAGGTDGLQALQAVSIIAGLPYTAVVCFMCWALWDVLSEEYDRANHLNRHVYEDWATGLLDVVDFPTYTPQQAGKTAAAVVAPFYFAARGAAWADEVSVEYYLAVYGVLFCAWPLLLVLNTAAPGLWAVGWVLFLAFMLHMAYERGNLRSIRNIKGSVLTDVMLSVVLYPLVAVQMHDEALAAQNERPAPQPAVTAPPATPSQGGASSVGLPSHDEHVVFPPVTAYPGGFPGGPAADRR